MPLEDKFEDGPIELADRFCVNITEKFTFGWEKITEQNKKSLMRCLYGLGFVSAICFSYNLRDSLNSFEMVMLPLYSFISWGNGEMVTSDVLPTEKIRKIDENKSSKSVGLFTTAFTLGLSATCILDEEIQKAVLPLCYVGLTTFSANTNYYIRRLINREK